MIRTKLLTVLLCMAVAVQGQAQTGNELFILGGELSNSAATAVEDIDEVMPRMKALGLNTVLVPAYWEFMEPVEGQYDFTLIDRTVQQARENRLQVVFLWFGAWKNSMSCYAPLWFKQNTKRFPRARTEEGKPLEIACCFSEEVFQADNRAFGALMKHLSKTAADVVPMVQVENEIGMLESARDHSKLADNTYKKGVPQELTDYLKKNEKSLHPWLKQRLRLPLSSLRTALPSWTELFGDDIYTDEIFMTYYYARYVGRLCETARRYTQMPLYVNAAMNSRGRQPGQYPSAGPLAHLIDLWHAGASQLLCLAPDIYDTGFKGWADQYALQNNRLFIPESRCCENSGVRALYAFGEHRALGFSPFAIDQASPAETESVSKAYDILRQMRNFTAQRTGKSAQRTGKSAQHADCTSYGLLFDQQDKERIVTDDGMTITCRHYFTLPWDPRATDGSTWPEGGAILMRIGKNDYLLAGSGVVVSFASAYEKAREEQKVLGEDGFEEQGGNNKEKVEDKTKRGAKGEGRFDGTRIGIGAVDEVTIDETGALNYLRRHNGDQDHQGRHARIACGDWKILHIRLYEYR